MTPLGYLKIGVLAAIVLLVGFLYVRMEHAASSQKETQAALNQAKADKAALAEEIERHKQNVASNKASDQSAQADEYKYAPVREEIRELDAGRFLNEKESNAVFHLVRHFNCDSILPSGSPDCSRTAGSVLQQAPEARAVSIESAVEAWGITIEYAHDLERTVTCYEESQEKMKK